jgi:predicted nucleic acid-binding protein
MIAEGLVFVDTNIFAYALTSSPDARHDQARSVLDLLFREDRLCASTQVLQELYVTLTRKYSVPVESAIRDIEDLDTYPIFQTDKGAIVDAAYLAAEDRISFWDSLVLVAALRLGATVILTEDLNHGPSIRGVAVVNPFR